MTKSNWTLVREGTNTPVAIGETIVSFRGLETILLGGSPPHKPSSSGKVWVENAEYYPSVFNLKWVETPTSQR
jgi:hypothetical protein